MRQVYATHEHYPAAIRSCKNKLDQEILDCLFSALEGLFHCYSTKKIVFGFNFIKFNVNVYFTALYRYILQSVVQYVFFTGAINPNSDQHQISPCNINPYSTPEVMRIKNMITQGEFY